MEWIGYETLTASNGWIPKFLATDARTSSGTKTIDISN